MKDPYLPRFPSESLHNPQHKHAFFAFYHAVFHPLSLSLEFCLSLKWEVWLRLLSIPLTINRLNPFDNYIMHYHGRAAPLPTINGTGSSIERAGAGSANTRH